MESTVFKNLNILYNEEYRKFRKKFSSLIQQVNKLKIKYYFCSYMYYGNCYYYFLNLLLQQFPETNTCP
jgi:hypothetical protein